MRAQPHCGRDSDPKTLAETDGQPDGFQAYLLALREEVIAFRRPVAYEEHFRLLSRAAVHV